MSRPVGRRVKSLGVLCTRCRVPAYEAVRDGAVYSVVMPSYLVTGGDGFSMIQNELRKHDSGETPRLDGFGPALLFLTHLLCFQGTWTSLLCPSTSHGDRASILQSRDASRSSPRPPD